MLKPSFFRKQNLSPKQKAILSYWQERKGIYLQSSSTTLVKSDNPLAVPPFNETEYRELVNFSNEVELLEYYMWTHILDAVSLSDTEAQSYYSELVSFIQITTFGMPCGLEKEWGWPEEIDHNHDYYSWHLGKVVKYSEGLKRFMFYSDKFFSSFIQTAMLNLYLDDAASPLLSQELLERIFSLDIKMQKYLHTLTHPIKIMLKGGIIEAQFDKHVSDQIDQAEDNIRALFQPLEVFDLKIDNEKMLSCKKRVSEQLILAKQKAKLDNT